MKWQVYFAPMVIIKFNLNNSNFMHTQNPVLAANYFFFFKIS